MKYEDPSTGEIYQARSAAGIVRQMSRGKLASSASRKTYRQGVADRLRETMGLQVDVSSDTLFLASLTKAGVLTERE